MVLPIKMHQTQSLCAECRIYIAAPDFLSRDLFARYGQTYQLFINGAVHVPTVFA